MPPRTSLLLPSHGRSGGVWGEVGPRTCTTRGKGELSGSCQLEGTGQSRDPCMVFRSPLPLSVPSLCWPTGRSLASSSPLGQR